MIVYTIVFVNYDVIYAVNLLSVNYHSLYSIVYLCKLTVLAPC